VQVHGGVKEYDQNEPSHGEPERTADNFFRKEAKDAFERELRRSSGLLAWMES
jgi:hypothetical protein